MNKFVHLFSVFSLIGFLGVIAFLVRSFGMATPSMVEKILMGVAILLFGVVTVFFWRENEQDERAIFHTRLVDRIAFLVCAGGLLLVSAYDVFTYMYDTRLLLILAIAVLVKVIGHWHAAKHL